ncbi:MAG: molybdopterin molybdotransferase MoeA [Lachnospiraceae bacterium]|nr:molybdopterin molybdotransferase MoeA [Lachnospiraceae bacterium]
MDKIKENNKKTDYLEAVKILVSNVTPIETCRLPLEELYGRILAEDIIAKENVPSFSRSPYDGYAFRALDTREASEESPVLLKVIENIRAGQLAKKEVGLNTAIRLMTGAAIPEGADAVCKYEDTDFSEHEVYIKKPYAEGDNIIYAGEDIKKGSIIAKAGSIVDEGMAGAIASLGYRELEVYRRVKAGIISTGDELVEPSDKLSMGKIRNSNRYSIAGALKKIGIESIYLGHARDDTEELVKLINKGERDCDLIISTGGVSVGDYDLLPKAMEEAGYELPVRGVKMKPGMACAYGLKKGRIMLALSGNPASSLTNLQCICLPALKKLTGLSEYEHNIIKMKLKGDCKKAGKGVRFIRGRLEFEEGELVFIPSVRQGNIVISSAINCNAYGIISEDDGKQASGYRIEGFTV